jgi:hypothetical protein
MWMMSKPSLGSLIHSLVAEGKDPKLAAQLAIQKLPKSALVPILMPMVESMARDEARKQVRALEDRVYRRIETGADPSTERRRLAYKTFYAPDFGYVLWGEATVEQHRARAQMQRQIAGECLVDAERHEEAADLIERSGATCLNEIAEAA